MSDLCLVVEYRQFHYLVTSHIMWRLCSSRFTERLPGFSYTLWARDTRRGLRRNYKDEWKQVSSRVSPTVARFTTSALNALGLKLRLLHAGLIWCYRIVFGLVNVESDSDAFFTQTNTGSHKLKLPKRQTTTANQSVSSSCHHYFSYIETLTSVMIRDKGNRRKPWRDKRIQNAREETSADKQHRRNLNANPNAFEHCIKVVVWTASDLRDWWNHQRGKYED